MTSNTAVSSEAWAKLRDWASVAGKGRLLLSGSVVLASLKATVNINRGKSSENLSIEQNTNFITQFHATDGK